MEMERAERKDFDLVLDYIKAFRPNDRYYREQMKALYYETIKDPQNFVFFLQEAGEKVAFMHGMLIYSCPHYGKAYHLSTIIVNQAKRRKGYGRLMMDYVKKQAEELGCHAVVLESALYRKEAHAFYEAYGFQKFGYNFELRLGQPVL